VFKRQGEGARATRSALEGGFVYLRRRELAQLDSASSRSNARLGLTLQRQYSGKYPGMRQSELAFSVHGR